MKNRFLMKKWNSACKNAVEIQIMINLWKLEDQYTIIFLLALFPEEPWEIHFFEKSFEHVGLNFPKCLKINENGSEWVRHGSPRAHIRWGRSYKLSDASGRPPDAPWGRFKAILIDFWSKRGRQNLPENFPYISFLKGPQVVQELEEQQYVSLRWD